MVKIATIPSGTVLDRTVSYRKVSPDANTHIARLLVLGQDKSGMSWAVPIFPVTKKGMAYESALVTGGKDTFQMGSASTTPEVLQLDRFSAQF